MVDITQTPQPAEATADAPDLTSNTTDRPKEADAENPRKKIHDEFRTRVAACKQYRRKLITQWIANIDFRRGKPFASQTDDNRVNVPLDWSMTKTKQASLFSQIPQVRVDHQPQTISSPWIHSFEQKLNDTLIMAGIEAAMDECLPDVINAAGIGAIIVAHESITEMKDVPAIDLQTLPTEVLMHIQQTNTMPDGSPVPTESVPQVVDHRYTTTRLSPADLLWPINFTGSDFDSAPWIGRSGRITWANAVKRFNLNEDEKDTITGEDRQIIDKLTHDVDREKTQFDEMVGFDELFYKDFQYDTEAKSFNTIRHMVFVTGKDTPVIDEPWKGQQVNPETQSIVGATRYPIRILTLAYITDETIPPSDSAMGRSQIQEINKARTQVIMQRERSIPVRWFDVNRVDTSIQHALMRGRWQAMIPVQGDGDKILGEVARANMPQENFNFDKTAKSDLAEIWSVGPNQQGTGADVETSGEAKAIESNFQTRIGRERAKVAKFFCSISEVLGGLLCIFETPDQFGQGFDPSISKALSFSILADSTVLLDSNQRLERLINFVNFTAKSGWLNLEPVLKEIATLSGLDPNVVIVQPQPKPPVEPNISLRFTGIEDLSNPLVLAFLINSGQAPSAELVEQAKKLISMSTITPMPIPEGEPGPAGPDGKPGKPAGDIQFTPNLPILGPTPPEAKPEEPQPPTPAGVGNAHPEWSGMPRVNKRTESEGGGTNDQ